MIFGEARQSRLGTDEMELRSNPVLYSKQHQAQTVDFAVNSSCAIS